MRKLHCWPVSVRSLIVRGTYVYIAKLFGETSSPVILLNCSFVNQSDIIHPLAEVRRMLCIARLVKGVSRLSMN